MLHDLQDAVRYQLTNSAEKHAALNNVLLSAETADGRAMVAAIAILIDEVIQLKDQVADLQTSIDAD